MLIIYYGWHVLGQVELFCGLQYDDELNAFLHSSSVVQSTVSPKGAHIPSQQ